MGLNRIKKKKKIPEMQGPLEGLDSVFLLSTNYKESIFVNILIVTSVQIRPFSYFFVFSRPKRYKGSPYNKCSPYLYKYLILISEMECPLCFQYTLQVYLHLRLFFTLCKRCTQYINPRTRRLAYVFKTLLTFQLSRDIKQGNKRLKSHFLHSKTKISQENFQRDKPQKEDSESLTISTQESDNSKEFLVKQQKAKFDAIKDKCHETVKSITRELEPMKQTYQKTKDKIYTSTINFKQRIVAAHQQYTNLSAEMPPIATITMDSLKQGFKGISNFFF